MLTVSNTMVVHAFHAATRRHIQRQWQQQQHQQQQAGTNAFANAFTNIDADADVEADAEAYAEAYIDTTTSSSPLVPLQSDNTTAMTPKSISVSKNPFHAQNSSASASASPSLSLLPSASTPISLSSFSSTTPSSYSPSPSVLKLIRQHEHQPVNGTKRQCMSIKLAFHRLFQNEHVAQWLLSKDEIPPSAVSASMCIDAIIGEKMSYIDHEQAVSTFLQAQQSILLSSSNIIPSASTSPLPPSASRVASKVPPLASLSFVCHGISGPCAFMTMRDFSAPFSFIPADSKLVPGPRRTVVLYNNDDDILFASCYWLENGMSYLMLIRYSLRDEKYAQNALLLLAPFPEYRTPRESDIIECALAYEEKLCQYCILRGPTISECTCSESITRRMLPTLPQKQDRNAWSMWSWYYTSYLSRISKIHVDMGSGLPAAKKSFFTHVMPSSANSSAILDHHIKMLMPAVVNPRHDAQMNIPRVASTNRIKVNALVDKSRGNNHSHRRHHESDTNKRSLLELMASGDGEEDDGNDNDNEDALFKANRMELLNDLNSDQFLRLPPPGKKAKVEHLAPMPAISWNAGTETETQTHLPINPWPRANTLHRGDKPPTPQNVVYDDKRNENEKEREKSKDKDPTLEFMDEATGTCKACGSLFARKYDLKRHVKAVHIKEKDHECQDCGKKFSLIQHLSVHRNQVHQEKDTVVKCTMCDKSFVSNTNRRRHFRLIHGVNPSEALENNPETPANSNNESLN